MNQLEQLKQHTIIVADSGDIDSIIAYQPEDATTNPSLIYKAAQLSQYQALIKEAVTTLKSRLAGKKIAFNRSRLSCRQHWCVNS
jgi:transaldolase